MIAHTVEHLHQAGINSIVAVIGYAAESVKQALGSKVIYAFQRQRLGTGHAFKIGLGTAPKTARHFLSLYGDDSAFYPQALYQHLVADHLRRHASVTLLTLKVSDPSGLGRIVRDHHGNIKTIVEEKNATPDQAKIQEINTGLYCLDALFARQAVKYFRKNPVSCEYYLNDLIDVAYSQKKLIHGFTWPNSNVWFGVNTPQQYQQAQTLLSQI